MIVVHDRDQSEIYENPLIECTITGLMDGASQKADI